jgi:hypothetical protein
VECNLKSRQEVPAQRPAGVGASPTHKVDNPIGVKISLPPPTGRPRSPNRHQPKKPAQDSVGAREVRKGRVGLYGRPLMGFVFPSVIRRWNKGYAGHTVPQTASIKAPTPPYTATAPTDVDGFFLKLMPIGRPLRSPNRLGTSITSPPTVSSLGGGGSLRSFPMAA